MRHALSAWAPPYVLLERPTSHIHLIPVPRELSAYFSVPFQCLKPRGGYPGRESKGEADVDIARLPAKYPPAPQEYGFQKKGSLLTAPGVPITIRLSICMFSISVCVYHFDSRYYTVCSANACGFLLQFPDASLQPEPEAKYSSHRQSFQHLRYYTHFRLSFDPASFTTRMTEDQARILPGTFSGSNMLQASSTYAASMFVNDMLIPRIPMPIGNITGPPSDGDCVI